jgi:hypothetical protein
MKWVNICNLFVLKKSSNHKIKKNEHNNTYKNNGTGRHQIPLVIIINDKALQHLRLLGALRFQDRAIVGSRSFEKA